MSRPPYTHTLLQINLFISLNTCTLVLIDLIPRPIHWYCMIDLIPRPIHCMVLIDLIPMQALASESEGEDSSWLKMQDRNLPFGLVTVCSSCKLWQLPV